MAQKLKAHEGRDRRWRVYARAFLHQVRGTGKQVVTTKTVYGDSKKEAEAAAATWIAEEQEKYQKTGTVRQSCKDTLAVYGRKWLDGQKPTGPDGDLKRSTWEGYDALFRSYVEAPQDTKLPRVGPVRMRELEAQHVLDLYRYLNTTPNKRHQQSKGRAKALHAVLRRIFKHALTNKVIHDPLDLMLRGAFGRQKHRRPQAYTGEQLVAFLQAANADHYRLFWYLFAFTGMRPSELLALTVEDVDLSTLTVHVTKRLRRLPERLRSSPEVRFELDEPKTENSVHDVLLPEDVVPIVQQHLAMGAAKNGKSARAKARQQWVGRYGHLLFTTKSGEPVDWNNLRMNYQRICRRAGLGTFGIAPEKKAGQSGPARQAPFKPLLKPYSLRHTHASVLLADGVPIEVISERLGHFKTSFTMDTYVGKQTGRQKLATDALSKRAKLLNTGTD